MGHGSAQTIGQAMSDETAMAVMEREIRVFRGRVPDAIAGQPVASGINRLVGNEFLLRDEGLACFYRKGEGVTVQLDDPRMAGTLELFLAGSVYSAIAAINGLTALHASAVAVGGRAVAFTGAPGAGKSTTAASMRRAGYPIVADDTLVLDTAQQMPVCLPGHKRLKLWPDALEMTGMAGQELVSEDYRKFFATEGGSEIDAPLPLGAIVSLAEGRSAAFEPVRGAARIMVLDDDHYTARHRAIARGLDRAASLKDIARLANSVPVFRFTRPLAREHYDDTASFLAERLGELNWGQE